MYELAPNAHPYLNEINLVTSNFGPTAGPPNVKEKQVKDVVRKKVMRSIYNI